MAHFPLSETVNKQNYRYWAESNPPQLHERSLYSPKVKSGVLCPDLGWSSRTFMRKRTGPSMYLPSVMLWCWEFICNTGWRKWQNNMTWNTSSFSKKTLQRIQLEFNLLFCDRCSLVGLSLRGVHRLAITLSWFKHVWVFPLRLP